MHLLSPKGPYYQGFILLIAAEAVEEKFEGGRPRKLQKVCPVLARNFLVSQANCNQ